MIIYTPAEVAAANAVYSYLTTYANGNAGNVLITGCVMLILDVIEQQPDPDLKLEALAFLGAIANDFADERGLPAAELASRIEVQQAKMQAGRTPLLN